VDVQNPVYYPTIEGQRKVKLEVNCEGQRKVKASERYLRLDFKWKVKRKSKWWAQAPGVDIDTQL
jgi:hypothetical protein